MLLLVRLMMRIAFGFAWALWLQVQSNIPEQFKAGGTCISDRTIRKPFTDTYLLFYTEQCFQAAPDIVPPGREIMPGMIFPVAISISSLV